MTEIIVAGFPKSGNTWLTRLLSDALDYPVTGVDDAVPLSADYQERHGDGVIRQLHLIPLRNNEPRFVSSRYHLNLNQYGAEKVIYIYRDPRDVAVSVAHYWELGDLHRVLTEVVACGAWPLWGTGWLEFMQAWRSTDLPHVTTCYEWLHEDTPGELRRLLDALWVKAVKPIDEVIQRQSLEVKRQAIKATDDHAYYLPHGITAQLKNLRGGRVGDWRAAFSERDKAAALELYGGWLRELGYALD